MSLCMGLFFTFFLALASVAQAQDYPARTVTLVVPYPPGGYGTTSVTVRAG